MNDLQAALAVRSEIDTLLADESWCHVLVPQRDLNWGAMMADTGRVVRRLRGRVMPTWPAYETEVSAALQFPELYETYPNAFDECLEQLDWLTTETGFLLFITQPELMLCDEPEHWPDVVEGLANAARAFAEPITDQGTDDRAALAFDVIVICSPDHREMVTDTWRQAGAPLSPTGTQ